jgi:hypothetical protein
MRAAPQVAVGASSDVGHPPRRCRDMHRARVAWLSTAVVYSCASMLRFASPRALNSRWRNLLNSFSLI